MEKNDYGLELRMKLSAYKEDIRGRQSSLRMEKNDYGLGTQFSCVANPNTHFQIAVDKLVFHQKVNCYKGKELLIENDNEAPLTKYMKARPGRLFKHDLEDPK